ncbi:MAG TPA: TetR/AcrR family transcriptional regulator [Pilimelia sp.]|nr:TetR/AcrR family transcriptional regulator [Pilimelia sp.]
MPTRADGRLVRGERTRGAILDAAVELATEVGLSGLSLSQLADRLGVSKSGLFAHWRSKEELQLATIDRAREQWAAAIVLPALKAPRGVRRLWALHEYRISFYQSGALPGDCFFANTEFEYAVRPGSVRDRLVEVLAEWLALIERLATEAIEAGDLPDTVDPAQLAFEIDAIGVATVHQSRLLDRAAIHRNARAAVLSRLRDLCTNPTLLPEA